MKKILLLLLLTTNVYAEEKYPLSPQELTLLTDVLKTQPPIVYDAKKEYTIENDIPSTQSKILIQHCQYGMDILGGCKNKPLLKIKKHARVL